jgi:hypothetical protein
VGYNEYEDHRQQAKPGMPGFEICWPGCDFRIRVLLIGNEEENPYRPGIIPGKYMNLSGAAVVEPAPELGEGDFPPMFCQLSDVAPMGYVKASISWYNLQRLVLLADIQ